MGEKPTADQKSIEDLLDTASLVFSGTVAKVAASTVDLFAARASFAVVRVDRGLQVTPELGELRGRLVTVDTAAVRALRRGDAAVFFTRSRVHGGGILTRELARLGIEREDDVAAAVARLHERRLAARLRQATLVVLGEVVAIRQLPLQAGTGEAPQWAAASLQVERTFKGHPPDRLTVLFPIDPRQAPADAPRLSREQRGVFVLHDKPAADLPPGDLPPGTVPLAVLHVADFQAAWLASSIEQLLAAAPPKVLVVNCIPQERSDENNDDTEPSLAVNPANPDQIVVVAATPPEGGKGDGPIYYSSDGGNTWRLVFEVPEGGGRDETLALTQSQRLYLSILQRDTTYLSAMRDSVPPAGNTLPTFDSRMGGIDQPWVEAVTAGGKDYLYVGYCDVNSHQSAKVDICLDASADKPVFQQLCLDPRQPDPRDGDEIRPVANPDGTVYVAYTSWRSQQGADTWGDIVVARDDNCGHHSFSDLTDPRDHLAGRLVATKVHLSIGTTVAGRVLSDLAIAVHPSKSCIVYLAWGDIADGAYSLRVRRSFDRGQNWSGDLITAPNSTLACLAINAAGAVGFLYQTLVGNRWETRFRRSPDGTTWDAPFVLARTAPAEAGQFVGDYARVVAVGNDFCGVFPAMNDPDPQYFPCGVKFWRNVSGPDSWLLLSRDLKRAIHPSVDPFFFKIFA
jgi:hypothetical protein